MKIIKDGSRYLDAKKIYDKANEDCGRCPCCGLVSHTSVKVIDNFFEYLSWVSPFREYETEEYVYDRKRKERIVKMAVREYTCHNCGAIWQSEPYPAMVEEIVNGKEESL